MKSTRTKIALALTALLGFAALAAAPQPPDLSSPQAAAKSLYWAVQGQDAAAVEAVFYAETPPQEKLVHAFADLLVASKTLHDAAKTKFGAAGDKMTQTMMSQEELADIDAGAVKIDNDTATLVLAGQSRPMSFHRTAGRWQLVVTDYAHATAAQIPHQVEQLKAVTDVMNANTRNILDGKFANADEAQAALQNQYRDIMIAAVQQTPPATQAATQP